MTSQLLTIKRNLPKGITGDYNEAKNMLTLKKGTKKLCEVRVVVNGFRVKVEGKSGTINPANQEELMAKIREL